MDDKIIKVLEKLGYTNINSEYYSYIKNWENYWKNNVDYITYRDFYGKQRKMFTLGMAKTVCEEWASALWSENDEITVAKENESVPDTLIDATNDIVYEISEDYDMKNNIPKAVENACWSGTCGAIQRLQNVTITKSGEIIATEKTKKELILVNAKNIIPLRKEHGKIVDVAFVSEVTINKKNCYYLEVHKLTDDGYEIHNIYIDQKTGREVKKENVIETIKTHSNDAWFSLLMPPKENPVLKNNGLGFSIYGNALDQIKACDVVYNNFVMDFYLGGKKIIYNKSLIRYGTRKVTKPDGTIDYEEYPIYPDDITKQQFMETSTNESTVNEKELIHEYNPDLRTTDNEKGIQMALNMLSPKVMLGNKYYEFNGNKIVTATEYVGDKQDFSKNAKKFRNKLNKFIENIIRTSLYIEKTIFKNNIDTECEILIGSTDGFMVDQETERNQARQDLASGVISKVEYRMKVFHETEEEAQEAIAKINQEYEINESAI